MKSKRLESRVLKQNGNSTNLLIRAGDTVVQANYSELAPCEFPVWTGRPVQVEVPSSGVKHHVAGLSSEDFLKKHADGGLPNTIKFPVYSYQTVSTTEMFENLSSSAQSAGHSGNAMLREPIAALGVSASGYSADGLRTEIHGVLPVWHDGTAVLVTLHWYEGEPSEGTPNPEWYLRGTEGMPLEQGLQSVRDVALLPAHLSDQRFVLSLSPWKLGEVFVGDSGSETHHKIWQREWRFTSLDEFRSALGRVCDGMLGQFTHGRQSLVGQRA